MRKKLVKISALFVSIGLLTACQNIRRDLPNQPDIITMAPVTTEAVTKPTEAASQATGPVARPGTEVVTSPAPTRPADPVSLDDIPAYSGDIYIEINNNQPFFTEEELVISERKEFTEFDSLGRCGACTAMLSLNTLTKEERGPIGHVRPSGWKTIKYPDLIEDLYLYNRCHLLGYQLTGENDNVLNLITGTRYFNIEGMLPFENKTARFIYKTGKHVLYRATPIFKGNDLVATGLLLEACSVEDKGDGLKFNVFIYNIQPGIIIDYSTGESWPETTSGK